MDKHSSCSNNIFNLYVKIVWSCILLGERSFFVTILLYGCTTWTLTKWLEKKLDGNYTIMLRAILNKSWRQHPTKHQLYGHLLPIMKTIQVRRTRHAGHCLRSSDDLINDVLLWSRHMTEQKQDGQVEHTFSSYVRIPDVALKTCQKRWTIGKNGERGSGISVLAAWHNDDDDVCQNVIMSLAIWKAILRFILSYITSEKSLVDQIMRIYIWSRMRDRKRKRGRERKRARNGEMHTHKKARERKEGEREKENKRERKKAKREKETHTQRNRERERERDRGKRERERHETKREKETHTQRKTVRERGREIYTERDR